MSKSHRIDCVNANALNELKSLLLLTFFAALNWNHRSLLSPCPNAHQWRIFQILLCLCCPSRHGMACSHLIRYKTKPSFSVFPSCKQIEDFPYLQASSHQMYARVFRSQTAPYEKLSTFKCLHSVSDAEAAQYTLTLKMEFFGRIAKVQRLAAFLLMATMAVAVGIPSDRAALLSFRDGLAESSQKVLQWNDADRSPCHWRGVECSAGRVVLVNLTQLDLRGRVSPKIGLLDALQTLDISLNSLSSQIPSEIANCSSLQSLFLNDNYFTGSIPEEIFLLPKLETLDLGFNSLQGSIPVQVQGAINLQFLGLYNNFLTGTIPGGIFSLPKLETLFLNTNNLSGSIPEFPKTCSLNTLGLHENELSGKLPWSIGACANLKYIYVSENELQGTIPASLGKLSVLVELFLDNNNFVGNIPKSLGKITSLETLSVDKNGLNGSIPAELGFSRNLNTLSLSENNLTGSIPSALGSLKQLSLLHIHHNRLTGKIPPEIGNCSSLTDLQLQNNFLEGTIPSEIGRLQNLFMLFLNYNYLVGRIPTEIGDLSMLEQLGLYNNSLTGQIPFSITSLRRLWFLSLAYNDLSGEIPFALGLKSRLQMLDLTGNRLTGKVPRHLCRGRALSVLDVAENMLEGSFPEVVSECVSLRRVILSNNRFSGSIRRNLNLNPSINYLDMKGNAFEGSIPSVFGLWSNLSMLDLSFNRFSGSIPFNLGKLSKLGELNLSSNMLSGSIPSELQTCLSLFKLDLSNNFLSGSIPNSMFKLSGLQFLNLEANRLTGEIPDSISSLHQLIELRLGENQLSGRIPSALGKLRSLSVILDVSRNKLTGAIPAELGNLQDLQRLDVSSNKLFGSVPSQLGDMSSLTFVNLSFNQLSGELPSAWGKFLKPFPTSFTGNLGLCLANTTDPCETGESRHPKLNIKKLVMNLVLASFCTFAGVGLLAYLYLVWKTRCSQREVQEHPQGLLNEIMDATAGLNDKYLIGKGKQGTVYRAELPSGKTLAVKKLGLSEKGVSGQSFRRELQTLGMVRHRNLVKIVGSGVYKDFGLIAYEYMSNGNLHDLLHTTKPEPRLDWDAEYTIALGVAHGLAYLHHDCVPQIIHRDIKPSNILLDSEMVPHIADFGLSKLIQNSGETCVNSMSCAVGTIGYMAPETGCSTKLSAKCDVFSYGVVLLELLTRKMAVDPSFEEGLDIVRWVNSKVGEFGSPFCVMDKEVHQWMAKEKAEALKVFQLALQCCEDSPNKRPSMREVVDQLVKVKSGKDSVSKYKGNNWVSV